MVTSGNMEAFGGTHEALYSTIEETMTSSRGDTSTTESTRLYDVIPAETSQGTDNPTHLQQADEVNEVTENHIESTIINVGEIEGQPQSKRLSENGFGNSTGVYNTLKFNNKVPTQQDSETTYNTLQHAFKSRSQSKARAEDQTTGHYATIDKAQTGAAMESEDTYNSLDGATRNHIYSKVDLSKKKQRVREPHELVMNKAGQEATNTLHEEPTTDKKILEANDVPMHATEPARVNLGLEATNMTERTSTDGNPTLEPTDIANVVM